ncbi:MAG: Helicase associated domain protein [Thermodesulfobacteriota bacterium]
MFIKDDPYDSLPLLPPDVELESKAVLKKAIAANRQLAELKGLANTIPNQNILINSITLQEARSSSEIENVVTTNDKLFEAFSLDSENVDSATKEVLRYREALWEGYQLLQERHVLSTNLFIRVCNIIKQNQAGVRNTPGTKIANQKTGEIIYTPPSMKTVIQDKLKNLETYIHDDDDGIDILIKLAVVHYQFEAIHPFSDGNGRTGRIINVLFLVFKGVLDLPILFLSQYIIANKGKYYKYLRQVTEKNQWENWILFILDGIEQTARATRDKIIQINDLFETTLVYAKQKLPNYMYSKELVEQLFEQPYCKVKFLVANDIAQRQQASKYLQALENVGILKQKKVGREKLYLNTKLFELLSNTSPLNGKVDDDDNGEEELFETLDGHWEEWEEMFKQLSLFIEEHEHSSVSKVDPKTKKLGYWVTDQRIKKKSGLLSKEQLDRLEEIGFDWEPVKNRWEKNYKELADFKKRFGHCDVPLRFDENPQLSHWVRNQRNRYKSEKLSHERTQKLERLGFTWGSSNVKTWEERIEELLEYQAIHGHLHVSQVEPDEKYRSLGKWLNDQRHYRKQGRLDPEYEKKLDEIGIAWNVLEAKWEEKLSALKKFYDVHGHFRVSQRGEQKSLGFWVSKIRRQRPTPERLKRLESIGFDWDKEKSDGGNS